MNTLPADPVTDLEIMLDAWRAGTPACRDVALQLAEDNRARAERTPDRLSRGCHDAIERALTDTRNAKERT